MGEPPAPQTETYRFARVPERLRFDTGHPEAALGPGELVEAEPEHVRGGGGELGVARVDPGVHGAVVFGDAGGAVGPGRALGAGGAGERRGGGGANGARRRGEVNCLMEERRMGSVAEKVMTKRMNDRMMNG